MFLIYRFIKFNIDILTKALILSINIVLGIWLIPLYILKALCK